VLPSLVLSVAPHFLDKEVAAALSVASEGRPPAVVTGSASLCSLAAHLIILNRHMWMRVALIVQVSKAEIRYVALDAAEFTEISGFGTYRASEGKHAAWWCVNCACCKGWVWGKGVGHM
jgi:hypothetical protein